MGLQMINAIPSRPQTIGLGVIMTKSGTLMIALTLAGLSWAVAAQPVQADSSVSAASTSTPPGSIVDPPVVRNHFAFGYCTWYVATKRNVPWFGNAIDWWPNARSYGYAEGQMPVVGAIMVTRESSWGHVAYVESVNGDGSWTVSEMNYRAWNVVSRRTLKPGQAPIVGFIYRRG
jgi:surface antigen